MERAEQRNTLVARVVAGFSSVFAVLFPSDCRLCSTPLVSVSRLPVCPECLDAIEPIRVPQCVGCGERLLAAQLLMGDGQCQACRDYPPDFERAVSFGEYAGGLRDLIHLLKYESIPTAAPVLGAYLATAVETLSASREDTRPLIVPVPLHASKRRSRGFNQAEMIARAATSSLPAGFEFAPDLLRRTRDTHSQVGLDREQRIANMRGAFRVMDKDAVKGRTVIVVDDVMTTGTTVSECARVLKKAGAEKVLAATVARALKSAVSPQVANRGVEEAIESVEEMVSV